MHQPDDCIINLIGSLQSDFSASLGVVNVSASSATSRTPAPDVSNSIRHQIDSPSASPRTPAVVNSRLSPGPTASSHSSRDASTQNDAADDCAACAAISRARDDCLKDLRDLDDADHQIDIFDDAVAMIKTMRIPRRFSAFRGSSSRPRSKTRRISTSTATVNLVGAATIFGRTLLANLAKGILRLCRGRPSTKSCSLLRRFLPRFTLPDAAKF